MYEDEDIQYVEGAVDIARTSAIEPGPAKPLVGRLERGTTGPP